MAPLNPMEESSGASSKRSRGGFFGKLGKVSGPGGGRTRRGRTKSPKPSGSIGSGRRGSNSSKQKQQYIPSDDSAELSINSHPDFTQSHSSFFSSNTSSLIAHNNNIKNTKNKSGSFSTTTVGSTNTGSLLGDDDEAAEHMAKVFGGGDGSNNIVEGTTSRRGSSSSRVMPRRASRRMSGANSTLSAADLPPPALNYGISTGSSYYPAEIGVKKNPVVESLMSCIHKEELMDVVLLGAEGVRVPSCRFILACRTELQQLFYEKEENGELKREISLGNYSKEIIEAFTAFCFSDELPEELKEETVAAAVGLVQLADMCKAVGARKVADEAYQLGRRLMNRQPALACSVYQETATREKVRDSFETYAIQTIEDCAVEALLVAESEHISSLEGDRLNQFLKEHLEDVEDLMRIRIIARWLNSKPEETRESSMEYAKQCTERIKLEYMEPDVLLNTVQDTGLFTQAEIERAIAQSRENQENDAGAPSSSRKQSFLTRAMNVDRVLVTGAGLEPINGLYIRDQESDDILYTKEEDSDCEESFGLTIWGNVWGIATSLDLSHNFYTRKVSPNGGDMKDKERPPAEGWQTEMIGVNPPPTCEWIGANATGQEEKGEASISLLDDSSGSNSKSAPISKSLPACFVSEEALYGN